MPAKMFRTAARGWSHWSPGVPGLDPPYDQNPRLFFTRKGADNCRVMWATGVWRNGQSSGSYFDPPEDTGPEPHDPPAPRDKADLEIVPFDLTEVLP